MAKYVVKAGRRADRGVKKGFRKFGRFFKAIGKLKPRRSIKSLRRKRRTQRRAKRAAFSVVSNRFSFGPIVSRRRRGRRYNYAY